MRAPSVAAIASSSSSTSTSSCAILGFAIRVAWMMGRECEYVVDRVLHEIIPLVSVSFRRLDLGGGR